MFKCIMLKFLMLDIRTKHWKEIQQCWARGWNVHLTCTTKAEDRSVPRGTLTSLILTRGGVVSVFISTLYERKLLNNLNKRFYYVQWCDIHMDLTTKQCSQEFLWKYTYLSSCVFIFVFSGNRLFSERFTKGAYIFIKYISRDINFQLFKNII